MSLLALTLMVLLLSSASGFTYNPRTEAYFNNEYINKPTPRTPPPKDKCEVSRITLIRVLKWIINLISDLHEAGQVAKEQESANMKITQFRTPSRSFSFFPIYYRNSLPWYK